VGSEPSPLCPAPITALLALSSLPANMATEEQALGGMVGCVCVGMVLFCMMSFTTLAPTEMAVKYNWLLQSVANEPVTDPGLKFVTPFVNLWKYPKKVLTLQYSNENGQLLDARTKDGLPLNLGVSFQYQLNPGRLVDLYKTYEHNYEDYFRVYRLFATHIITETATNYEAHEYLTNKAKIAAEMNRNLNDFFSEHLFATVDMVQIMEDTLPQKFTDAINKAQAMQRNKTTMQKKQVAQNVTFETDRNNARARAYIIKQQGVGQQARIMQDGNADKEIIKRYVTAESEAYKRIHDDVNLQGDDLLKYMWYDVLGGGGVAETSAKKDVAMLLGVNPAAYISPTGGTSAAAPP